MSENIIFEIILHGGNARSLAMEAINAAKTGRIQKAKSIIKSAEEEVNIAHNNQTKIIQGESAGDQTDITLLMIHAQDHLMNAITVIDLAKEFVELYKRMEE